MKKLYVALLILAFTACSGGEKITIEVKDLRDQLTPEVDPASHQAGDVDIFRSSFMGDSYSVIMYCETDDGLKGFQTYVKASQHFNEATYQWADSETLNFILMSKENGQYQRHSVTISEGTARLENID